MISKDELWKVLRTEIKPSCLTCKYDRRQQDGTGKCLHDPRENYSCNQGNQKAYKWDGVVNDES